MFSFMVKCYSTCMASQYNMHAKCIEGEELLVSDLDPPLLGMGGFNYVLLSIPTLHCGVHYSVCSPFMRLLMVTVLFALTSTVVYCVLRSWWLVELCLVELCLVEELFPGHEFFWQVYSP